ncbi:lipopolysaccharide kinase InaA family protein [Seonamhaeicola sp. ML3]|uniref:lipopolysaccharide kinase InaA family protein n=1 Tax=Seonamhaeicola sp. ML3 TaxID=2937786 RepID=UPI00200C1520|nr:lipopolysaccharide kinase InaA family protein [Seonamhaeicola sp. ML3]
MKHFEINEQYLQQQSVIHEFVDNFDVDGIPFGDQDRNSLKLFQIGDDVINIKSFRVPNFFNRLAYNFFRKSKAQRSFEYANKLIALGVGTPQPIAYFEFKSFLFFNKSYYVSEQLDCDLTYRELTLDLNFPNHEAILRAFTRFTYNMHEKGIHFLDHSPGNTLIKINNGSYEFSLVDLNRMEFKPLDFETRIKNFSRLTVHKSMIEIMSDEYAKCINEDYDKVYNLMLKYTKAFQERYYRKIRLKKRVFFWKKKYANRPTRSPL